MPVDPVCGMYVPEDSKLFIEENGKKYYFCSETCMKSFKNPEMEASSLRRRLVISWAFSIPVILINYIFHFHYMNIAMLFLSIPVVFYSGIPFYRGSFTAIKNRMGNMDLLISLGSITAFTFSFIITFFNVFFVKYTYYDAADFIITLILTGSYIESITKRRAKSSANRLLSILPEKAHLFNNGIIMDVRPDSLKENDIVLVRPGEIIPVDGFIISGESEINESMITGESMPVFKSINDNVISGTENVNGELKINVTGSGLNSTVGKINSMINMAALGRTKIQRTADIFSSYFVPVVIASALASSLAWYFYLAYIKFPYAPVISILVFVSVVVIACPCAIGLAAPVTLLISADESAGMGIIIKNASSMERLSKIDTVIFDKTGTLTENMPDIERLEIMGDANYIKSVIYSIEELSNHPVARALVKYLNGAGTLNVSNFREIPGYGVTTLIDNKMVEIKRQKNCINVFIDNQRVANILISYKIRESSYKIIKKLKENNIKTLIVTGDSYKNTKNLASKLGIDHFICSATPELKAKIVRKLQSSGKYVMFVGDGINDTVAMETADVGISMGSGSDISKETGDIILLNDDLLNVYNTIMIGRSTIKKIRQNIYWAIGYNSALIPVAAGIPAIFLGLSLYYVMPILAALAMGMSSTTVVLNSLRIRKSIENELFY
ncbi:heavy metal translocating P-type ATPase [Picrophilus oshimae]|uniref:Cu2+-exporting ATPase n=1 Tax=Picrophilus torridus (strain ATCC 700027 / DSM 9790 / JCM 10055 / NBRC 100828 / KAW 2/3) TaxID=1122961 RepID=A0A8G2FXX1_PICTO|nr:heavy metal translocating P-type ATPase [Picrophilus oshimae]SMD31536.1 Cu2+-exporting ATPase [Picrophilus oshimae DSM 9789]